MAVEIVMPKLGWTMEEGVLAEWIKKDGDTVEPGDIIFTVESDKALQEIESFDSGILRIPPDSPPVGSTVKVGGILAYLVSPGESLPVQEEASTQTPKLHAATSVSTVTQRHHDQPAISPRARRVAAELGVEWRMLHGSGSTGRIVERDVRAAAQVLPPAAEITPVARRAAQELGVDLDTLATRFSGERITLKHVEEASKTTPDSSAIRTPITSIRRTIAERMSSSAHTTAPVTLTTEADATELVNIRKQLKNDTSRIVPSYTDLLAKLTSDALQEHPVLNARLEGDSIVQSSSVHIGIATDSERGLLVPVIRDVTRKNLRQIATESAALIERARAGALKAEELQGSTFTITNLGMYDIDAFTPIINLPECAILGVGRIVPKQVVIDVENEHVAIRHMMFLSLTFDHRLVDGAPAARFLQRIKQLIEKPYLWLVG